MAKKKNPVSEYLSEIGRRGGETTGRKGLAAMSDERRKEIQRQGVEARLANRAKTKRKPRRAARARGPEGGR